MSDAGPTSTLRADPPSGSRKDRIRELIALAESDAPLADSVPARILELAGDRSTPGVAGPEDTLAAKEERRRLADVLARACSDPAHLALVEAAVTEEPFARRWVCAFALARSGRYGRKVVEVAVEALGEPDGDVRWAAAEILCHARSVAEPLIIAAACAVSETSDAAVRRRKMALYCMRDLGIAETWIVCEALRARDAGVRLAALAAVRVLAVDDVRATYETVRCMRQDAEPGVRRAAAAILGRLRGDVGAARMALREVAGDENDPHLRRAAVRALDLLKAV